MYIKTNHPGYVVDSETGAIINQNYDDLEQYKKRIEEAKKKRKLEQDVQNLQSDMKEIKELLKLLVDGKING